MVGNCLESKCVCPNRIKTLWYNIYIYMYIYIYHIYTYVYVYWRWITKIIGKPEPGHTTFQPASYQGSAEVEVCGRYNWIQYNITVFVYIHILYHLHLFDSVLLDLAERSWVRTNISPQSQSNLQSQLFAISIYVLPPTNHYVTWICLCLLDDLCTNTCCGRCYSDNTNLR